MLVLHTRTDPFYSTRLREWSIMQRAPTTVGTDLPVTERYYLRLEPVSSTAGPK